MTLHTSSATAANGILSVRVSCNLPDAPCVGAFLACDPNKFCFGTKPPGPQPAYGGRIAGSDFQVPSGQTMTIDVAMTPLGTQLAMRPAGYKAAVYISLRDYGVGQPSTQGSSPADPIGQPADHDRRLARPSLLRLLGEARPEHLLVELTHRGLGHLVDELNAVGEPPLRDSLLQELADLVGIQRAARTRDNAGARPLAPALVGTAITAASSTSGWAMIAFSSSTELIHSPPDLTRSLVLSTSLMNDPSTTSATSPVRSHPSSVNFSTPVSSL